MLKLDEIILRLSANAEAVRLLVEPISDEQGHWKPDPETWSLQEVMEHLYNEERLDFRKHLKEILADPPQPWGEFRPGENLTVGSCREALAGFLEERQASLAWLRSLASPAWEVTSPTVFNPQGEALTLSAGDVLVSWVAHDFLHLRQLNELLYAWNAHQAAPYSVAYGGEW
jgi:hypothetical protein